MTSFSPLKSVRRPLRRQRCSRTRQRKRAPRHVEWLDKLIYGNMPSTIPPGGKYQTVANIPVVCHNHGYIRWYHKNH